MEKDRHAFILEEATIGSVHQAMKEGALTCRDLVQLYIDRIEKYDKAGPTVNSVITLNPKALEIAGELDRKFMESGIMGPLHGIPVLLKDNIGTMDMPTTAGSVNLAEAIPDEDAGVTRKLKDAGAIILAKMNLHEFAIGGETVSSILGRTLNPYDLSRTPGGSSGGPAVGIAMNFGMVALGTDTVNSVRSPASGCNIVGFRPTYGLVSKAGVIPSSRTQDNLGPMTRTVEDAAKVLDVIRGYDAADPSTAWSKVHGVETYGAFLKENGLKGKRLGIMKSFFGKEEIHEAVNAVMEKAFEVMRNEGATLVEIEEEIDAVRIQKEISGDLHEFKAQLNKYLASMGSRSKVNSLKALLEADNYFKGIEASIRTAESLEMYSPDYNDRFVKRAALKDLITEILAKNNLDALVFPHQKRLVVKVGESQLERNGILGALTGFPACVVPGGFTDPSETAPLGVPVGIEFLTGEWNDAALFELVYGFEQATRHRKAPVLS